MSVSQLNKSVKLQEEGGRGSGTGDNLDLVLASGEGEVRGQPGGTEL